MKFDVYVFDHLVNMLYLSINLKPGLQLSLGCLLMRTIASFLRYTGYLNFINGPTSRVLLPILVHIEPLSYLFFRLLASLRLKTMSLNIAHQFMKETVKSYLGLLKIQVKFLIN